MVGIIAGRHADAALRFHEHVVVGRRPVLALDDDVRFGKPLFDVAMPDLDVLQQVAGLVLLVDQGGIWLPSLLGAGHHRQRFVLDLDKAQRLRCDLGSICGDDGHSIAQVADLVVAQGRPVGDNQAMAVAAWHVLVGQNGVYAGQGCCLAGVDGQDPGMRVSGAQCGSIEHPGKT